MMEECRIRIQETVDRRQERKSEVGVKEYLSIGLKGKAKSKALSLARPATSGTRDAENRRERLDRINRIYRIFAQDAMAGVGMA